MNREDTTSLGNCFEEYYFANIKEKPDMFSNRPITRYLSNHSLLLYTVIKNKTGGFIMSHPIVPLTIPL
ncbi:hypothetical protein, partial [Streptococcus suis]|uniref:hypothetical protein n=1 Tax=Streptococcus suis TaxID=1307 RepID=UPI002412D0B4